MAFKVLGFGFSI